MSIQTVFRAGNSQVVAIPADILSDLKIKSGDRVIVETTPENTINIKKAAAKTKTAKSLAGFNKWYRGFIDENGEILDELANR